MKPVRSRAQCQVQAHDARWKWLLLALLVSVAVLLAAGHAAPAHAAGPALAYVIEAADSHPDCGETPGVAVNHCHLTIACASYAQLDSSGTAAYQPMADAHPLPLAEHAHLGQTSRPNLQPPKHSSQA